ncbi:MAG: M42 family metallopeptidase [Phycisphaerae bacterium]
MRKQSYEFLKELLTTPSPSGSEGPGQKVWCDYVRQYADEVRTDSYGNAVAVLNPGGDPKIMIDGHADEIGLMVSHIDDKGFVYFQRIGGVDPALVSAKRVNIHNRKGVVRGVTGTTPVHLQERGKERKVPKMHEIFIDIGAADGDAARKKVDIGDAVTFVDDFEMLNDNVGVARGFDNRAGTWVAAEVLRLVKTGKTKPRCAIYACSSVQEEVGLMGAAMQVFNLSPDAAIVVDVTPATDTPGIDVKQHGECKISEGPVVTIGRENHPVLVDRLRKIARRKRIKIQTSAFSLSGGTDALVIFKAQGGVPSVVLSIPNRYTHSTIEMVDLRDMERAASLVAAFATDLKKAERFEVKV